MALSRKKLAARLTLTEYRTPYVVANDYGYRRLVLTGEQRRTMAAAAECVQSNWLEAEDGPESAMLQRAIWSACEALDCHDEELVSNTMSFYGW